jgi:hypothetical protein
MVASKAAAPKTTAKKQPAPELEAAVPTKKLRLPEAGDGSEESASQTTVPKPKVRAPADCDGLGSRSIMQDVVPWVLAELPVYMNKHKLLNDALTPMSQMLPLHISGAGQVGTSFKEAWSPVNCRTSLIQSNLYEAGGNLCWLDPEISGAGFSMPGDDPAWAWVWESSATLFETFVPDARSGCSGVERIRFPAAIHAEWRIAQTEELPKTTYPRKLVPLGGHAFIYAWFSVWQTLELPHHLSCPLCWSYRLIFTALWTVALCDAMTDRKMPSGRLANLE